MSKILPQFTEDNMDDIVDSDIDEYIAFVYDKEGAPVGTVIGYNSERLSLQLKENTIGTMYSYLLVKVIENYIGETIH